ncbi:MAG: tryptophan-rich sensory protein, partial [Kaistella sp.]
MTKKLQIANGFALVFTITFNYVSNTGIFNGKTIGNVSDQYHTLITPAGYAFSIWGLIYLLLLGFVIYTGRSLFYAEK